MSKSEQSTEAINFVQQAVAQLPNIEAIERELQGIDGGDS